MSDIFTQNPAVQCARFGIGLSIDREGCQEMVDQSRGLLGRLGQDQDRLRHLRAGLPVHA
ncbi:hypothetical protein [Octadecabacter sp. R77987]|uniref:hypothetical protein n=1 Tax=Octadecabacter sp. R77987 TaxID=3093874 RepID=UPI0036727078